MREFVRNDSSSMVEFFLELSSVKVSLFYAIQYIVNLHHVLESLKCL